MDLKQFLAASFAIKEAEKVCVLIDLENPADLKGEDFFKNEGSFDQAYEIFYNQMRLFQDVDLFAYRMTGSNHMELPREAVGLKGQIVDLKKDIYQNYDLIFSFATFSAAAPLAAAAKEHGFRGASVCGEFNVNCKEIAMVTEKMRREITGAESADIEFLIGDVEAKLHLYLGEQVAQKVDGICHKKKMWTSLPAGKVYFVPYDAEGAFPMKFSDGGIALMQIGKGCIKKMKLLSGSSEQFLTLQKKIESDKAFGIIGELGFGVAELTHSFESLHLGIGRNDHLKGSVNLHRFKDKKKAGYEEILFSKEKTAEIVVKKLMLKHNGKEKMLINKI